MPLAKQVVDIPFGGLETKVDAKLVPLGKSLALENAEFSKSGAISKRNGYAELTTDTDVGGSIASAKQFLRSGDRLFLDDGRGSLFEYAPTPALWKTVSTSYLSGIVREKRIPAKLGVASARDVDVAVANGLALYAWTQFGSGINYAVIDTATDTPIFVTPTSIGTLGSLSEPRVTSTGDFLVLTSIDNAGNLRVFVIDTNNPSSFASPFSATLATDAVVTGGGTGAPFDVGAMSANRIAIAYKTNVPQIGVLVYDVSANVILHGPVTFATTPGGRIGLAVTARGDTWVACRSTGGNLRHIVYDSNLSVVNAAATIDTDATIDFPVGVEDPATPDTVNWAYNISVTTGGVTYRKLRRQGRTRSGGTSHLGDVAYGVGAASRPFVRNGKTLIVGHYQAASIGGPITQSTYLLFDYFSAASSTVPAQAIGRILPGKALNDAVQDVQPSSVVSLSSDVMVCALSGVEVQDQVVDSVHGFTVMATLGVPFSVQLDFGAKSTYADIGPGALFSGMQAWSLEGDLVTGNNFHLVPELVSAIGSAGSGLLSDGSYEVAAVFMRIDKYGQVHFSGTSVPATVVLAGGTSTQKITVKVGGAHYDPCSYILIYVTGAGLSTFYEIIATNALMPDHAVTGIVTTVPTANREIYTTGGVLDNGAPPSFTSLMRRGKRVYGVTPDGVLWYTKEHIQGEGAAFVQETFVEQLLQDGGEDFAVVEMDDNIVVLGENSVQVVTGDGFNDTGTAGGLSEPRQTAIDAGRVTGTPYVRTSMGILFDSPRGLYLLGRSLDMQYIGRPVDSFNELPLKSAALVPGKSEVLFGTNGATLIYDYIEQSWSTFTGMAQVDAVLWMGTHVWVDSAGVARQQGAGFLDRGAFYGLAAESPWIKVDALQGYLKTFYASVLGTWKSPHTLTLKLYYDYDDTLAESFSFDASAGYTAGKPLQMRHYVGRKCEALKVRIEDSAQSGTGESCSITGVSLELGGLGGVFRQSKSKTV